MRSMLSRTLVTAVALAAVGVTAGPASAALQGVASDPNDVPGKLDIAVVRYNKANAMAPLDVVVRTHGEWRNRVLRENVNRLSVFIDVDADGTKDYTARIRKVPGGLYVYITGEGQSFEPLPATRPSERKVRFTIPGDSPPNPVGPVNVRASSRFIESQPCDPASGNPACRDRAPNSGWA